MRKLLATAVAIAPLLAATAPHAEVVVSTTRTTPINTSNAAEPGADNIRFSSTGILNFTSGAGVVLDSSHTVTLDGGSRVNGNVASAGSVGILVNGGNTGAVVIAGTVSMTDDILTATDTDSDGDLDGAFASGTDRYGVRVVGAAPFTGDITIGDTGTVAVDGNESFGVSIETDLIGDFQNLGGVRLTGDNGTAVRILGDVTGDVTLGGIVSATGTNSSAANFDGDISGRLTIQANAGSTGYRYTSRGTDAVNAKLDADDLGQNASAIIIGGNVAGGVVFDAPPVNADTANLDEDADGIPDANETTATINSSGAAPAVTVGSATRDITLGVVGAGDAAYGFINRGVVKGQGVFNGVSSTGVLFGVAGGQTVTIDGGIRNTGEISTFAYEAESIGVRLAAGVTTPVLSNTNALTAAATSVTATRSTAIQIDAGATLPVLNNSGTIAATAGNGVALVTAVRDLSGTLTSINNTRFIQALLGPNAAGAVTGATTAIDVSANTTGVTLVQSGTANTPTASDPDSDGDGVSNGFEPVITGDVFLGTGADVVDIRNGTVTGAIFFDDGADSLSITGGAQVIGALNDTDGLLDINVANGVLDSRNTAPTTISGLTIGGAGNLIVSIDPANSTNAGFVVTGAATLADGAGLGVQFASLIDGPEQFKIIDAVTLNYGAIDDSAVQSNSPYLFVVDASADIAAGDVFIDVRRRTADEADLINVEASAFDSVYSALGTNAALRGAFLAETGREGFIGLYEQLLPDHSGGSLMSLSSGVDAVTRALTGRNASAAPGETSAWVQEINFFAEKERTDTYGFESEGFGVAGGIERGSGLGAVGVSLAFTSSDLEDPEAAAEEVLSANLVELGLYWRAQGQNWTTWARAAGGYASFEATRKFVGGGLNLTNESDWNGFTLALAGGASYEHNIGRFSIRPEVYAEYFSLNEEERTETGGGAGFDLNIDEREGHLLSTTAAVNIGMGMGGNSWVRPELRVGWRQNISVDPGETVGRFGSGGPDFRLTPDTVEGGGLIVGARVNIGNALGMLTISADAEMIEDYVRYMLLLRASFRF